MNIDFYKNEWAKDAPLKADTIQAKGLEIPMLHAKYLDWWHTEKVKVRKLIVKRKELENKLEAYYNGTLDGKDIGRDPNPIILKSQDAIKRKVDSDPEMIEYNISIIEAEETSHFLDKVMDSISFRGNNVKTIVDYMIFLNGGR